tara:strand:+ start:2705 stop:4111 length:1407 start_codon:yes stop_codon:yes gene_type:complete
MRKINLKDYNSKDTIAAIATFTSKSALGVIKISGKKALNIVSKIFKPTKKKDIKKVKTFTIHYGWIVDRKKGNSKTLIDEVLVSIMRSPNSYTKEDVIEISCHGGQVSINRILELILKQGARLAMPGEFSYRALINGRIDLLQAESIASIVDAKTNSSLNISASQLKGQASSKIYTLKDQIKDLFIQTESLINFPEEEIEVSLDDLSQKVNKISRTIESVLIGSQEARIIRQGLRCVICGRTNVGKSTLFNRLLKEERVIVSRIAGTTRDVVEEIINIRGVPLRIYDTAGILEPKDLITRKAIAKTSKIFKEADLVILVLDGSRKPNKDDLFLLDKVNKKNTILVINKIDLPGKLDLRILTKLKARVVKMSALKNIGLAAFERAVSESVYRVNGKEEDLIFLSHLQEKILKDISKDFQEISNLIKKGYTLDFINLILKNSLNNIGKITGEVFSEEVLESIFSQFCIGK